MTVEPYLALLVWATRRPVRMVWSRQESLLARTKRHPFRMRYRTGASGDGRILAQDVEIVGDAGAYPLLSPRVLFAAGVTACGPYDVPNVRIRSTAVFTNNVPTSAFRGFGAMQVTFGYESQLDLVAEAVGLSPVDVRLRNFVEQGDTAADPRAARHRSRRDRHAARCPRGARAGGHPRAGLARRSAEASRATCSPTGASRFFATGLPAGSAWSATAASSSGPASPTSAPARPRPSPRSPPRCSARPREVGVYIADSAAHPSCGRDLRDPPALHVGKRGLAAAWELRDRLAEVAAELSRPTLRPCLRGRPLCSSGARTAVPLARRARAGSGAPGRASSHLGTFHAEVGDLRSGHRPGHDVSRLHLRDARRRGGGRRRDGAGAGARYAACHDVGRAISPRPRGGADPGRRRSGDRLRPRRGGRDRGGRHHVVPVRRLPHSQLDGPSRTSRPSTSSSARARARSAPEGSANRRSAPRRPPSRAP